MTMGFIDAHNHLQDERLAPSRGEVIRELERLPLQACVVNGTREADWPAVFSLAREHSWAIPSLGLHPWYVAERKSGWDQRLEALVLEHRCAIGEIGLDRWIREYNSAEQESVFVAQLAIAARCHRPVAIHCLKAWGRLFEILQSEARPDCGFLLHSYGGPAEMVKSFVDLGGYFSLSGYFAHERKQRQQEVFRQVPLERLLLETDAPDMTPPAAFNEFHPGDASLNNPANIRAVYAFASKLLSLPAQKLAEQIQVNFAKLYGPVLPLHFER